MGRSGLELDFFSMEKEPKGLSSAAKPPIFERRRGFRAIQGVVSKINPSLLKTVIANGSLAANKSSISVPSTPKETQTNFAPLSLCDPALRLTCGYEIHAETAPMTIFYKGAVAVFNVSPHKAQEILKLAEEGLPKSAESSKSNSYHRQNLLETFKGDLPIARRKSLHRFLEKLSREAKRKADYGVPL